MRIIVCGCGTDVGKTIVSAILVHALKADYWKPIQCGYDSDTHTIKTLVKECHTFPSTYTFSAALSPHHAARLEDLEIDVTKITPPITSRPLIIEMAGGILVPLNNKTLALDLFAHWEAHWILVSKHYLGSINHTLLTSEALKQRNIQLHGIIFNGAPNPDTESAILHFSKLPSMGRLRPEPSINPKTIERYSRQWKPKLTLFQ